MNCDVRAIGNRFRLEVEIRASTSARTQRTENNHEQN